MKAWMSVHSRTNAKTLHIERLKMQLAVLRRARFGRSSEKLDHAIEQLELLIGELEADAGAAEARDTAGDTDARHPASGGNATSPQAAAAPSSLRDHQPRGSLHLPGLRWHGVQPYRPGRARGAGTRPLQLQGDPSYPREAELPRLRDDRRAADARPADRTQTALAGPARAGSGGEVLRPYTAAPPGRHLWLLADWVGQSVFLLDTLAEAIGRHVRAGQVLHADDTTVPVLAPGTGKTRTCRLWVVVRDERPFGSDIPSAAYYRYSPDRKGIHAQALLGGCRGFLHADGYAGFDLLRYLADGRLEMTNNAAERPMRAPVLGRKIITSAAPMPADNAPLVSTPSSSWQRCAASIRRPILPMFSNTSRIIPDHPINKIDALLPWLWTQ